MDAGDFLVGGGVALLLFYLVKSHQNQQQACQYTNSTQPVATPVCSCGYTYPCCGRRTPIGTKVIAKAGACAPIGSQCTNPVTPQTPTVTNKPPVPTGIFTVDNGTMVSVTCSDAATIQWYDTNDVMVAQNPVPANGVAVFGLTNGLQIDHCVLIGPGGSTIVANTIFPPLASTAQQPSPGSATANPTIRRPTIGVLSPFRGTIAVPVSGASAPFQSKGTCVPATSKFVTGGLGPVSL